MDAKTEIVEKRIKSTIIRRRAKVETPEEVVSQEKGVTAKESPKEALSSEKVLTPESTLATDLPPPSIPSSVEAAPAKKVEEEKPRFGLKVVGQINLKSNVLKESASSKASPTTTELAKPSVPTPLLIEEEENKDKKIKKGVKKSKRGELEVDLEGIGKVATLTQLTRLASVVTPAPEKLERERVFEPTRNSRKKRSLIKRDGKKTEITLRKASKRIIGMGEKMTVADFAHEMSLKSTEVIKKLMSLGTMVTANESIDFETASIVAHDFGYEIKKNVFEEAHVLNRVEDKPEDLKIRPPVVTVMGHVDHGKTSLLDAIRKTQVAQGEAGGITQHIGAYRVKVPKGTITFIDTPGHEAFTSMRARGASVTDIVILVVAADDGVMPQTVEAIHHAKAAGVPLIVAVNKIDKPGANLEQVKRQLSEHQLLAEDWGGDTIFASVSAKTGQGVEELLELILLQAEVLELKANPAKAASGVVIESRLDRGKGPVITLLVQEGTLHIGDSIVAGMHFGRVRAMRNEAGEELSEATPSTPVELTGLAGVPNAGEIVHAVTEDRIAKLVTEHRENKDKAHKQATFSKMKLEDLFSQIEKGEVHELRLVLKTDVQGSLEALRESLNKLSTEKVRVHLLHMGIGAINESDIMLASASNAIVVGFNVKPDSKAQETAKAENVQIRIYEVIYHAIEEIKKAMEGLLAPTLIEKYKGKAEVRNVFNISKVGTIAGSFVVDGVMVRNAKVRLLRDNVIVYNGKLSSLKRFKDDAKEVTQGYECGLGLENYNDIKVGDIVECYIVESIAGKL